MPQLKIKAAAFHIPVMGRSEGFHMPIYIPYLANTGIDIPWVTHNFWLLVKEENGEDPEIETAHAFATQIKIDDEGRTVYQPIPIGYFKNFLMIHFLKKPTPGERASWLPSDREDQLVVYGEDPKETEVLEKWKRLKLVGEVLNSYKIHYSAIWLGVGS